MLLQDFFGAVLNLFVLCLGSGFYKPVQSLDVVRIRTLALEIHYTAVVLGLIMALFCRLYVPVQSLDLVSRRTLAL